jgi:hypothetical protein
MLFMSLYSDLDHLREKFTFNVDNLSSYELGKAQHGKIPDAGKISPDNNKRARKSEKHDTRNAKIKDRTTREEEREDLFSAKEEILKVPLIKYPFFVVVHRCLLPGSASDHRPLPARLSLGEEDFVFIAEPIFRNITFVFLC